MTSRMPETWMAAMIVAAVSVLSNDAAAGIKAEALNYEVAGKPYVGYIAYDDAAAGKRPGVLIAPEWVGVNDYSRGRARQLAEMGYVAMVMDPYGEGKNASSVAQSAEWSGALKKDRKELRIRVRGAFDVLLKQPNVDPAKTAAIGYCFGGTTVLELARSGADVKGVVSFHGSLNTDMPAKEGELKAKVLVAHGADDPFVPPEEVAAFMKEMQAAKADWQFVAYGNAVHSFTNPGAGAAGLKGVAYEERADKRSWEAMKAMFEELFGKGN